MKLLQTVPTDSIPSSINSVDELKNVFQNSSTEEIINTLINWGMSLGGKILAAAVVFFIGKIIINWIYNITKKILNARKVDLSLTSFVLSLVKIVLLILLIISVIGILGIETSSFIAIFASAGIAVGMALSGTLQNFAGGVLILILKPYKIGDFIEAQGYTGTVKEIQIFNTILNTVDNKCIIIPNGGLSTGSINNYSKEKYRRIDWTVSVSYGDDFNVAKEHILKMLSEDTRVLQNADQLTTIYAKGDKNSPKAIEELPDSASLHSPVVFLEALADSSINIKVRAWALTSDYWGIFFDMNERIYVELPQKGLNFPFPQMDLHIKQS
ncbi:MAG: mechanosensitive ion channel [Bacteroidales bacterium]